MFSTSFDEGKTFRLTAIDDRNKNRIALTYDDGKLVEVKDSAGRIIKVTSTKEGQITSLQVKNAEHQGQWIRFARYEYDDKGRLVRVQDADDYAWTYAYDEHNRLVRDTDRVGLSFCFRYDEKDRGIEAWGEYIGKKDPSLADDLPKFLADGRTRVKGIYHRKFDYHKDGYTEVTDTTETRRYVGNKKGMLDKAVAGGAVTSSKYDPRGFEIEKTDPLGATWKWVKDERGRVLEEVDPLGRGTRYERDAYGLVTQVTDAAGGITKSFRDGRGNVEVLRDVLGGNMQFRYEERGLLTSVVEQNGAGTEYAYDPHANVIRITQPNGGAWVFTYDALGRRLSMVRPNGAETRYAYSNRGDLIAEYDPSGRVTRFSYDGERHPTQFVSPLGNVTQFVWGGFHQLALYRRPDNHAIRLAYNLEGELVVVLNEREEAYRLTYDRAGNLVSEQGFDGLIANYRNDLAGRAVRVETGAGEVTEFVYDLAGQLVERNLPDGSSEAFKYNARGELIAAQNAAGVFGFERDAIGRIVREVQSLAGEEQWVETAYDPVGNTTAMRTSLGGEQRTERDTMGSAVRTWLDDRTRVDHVTDLLAREVKRRLPGGAVVESEYEPTGRLAQRRVRSGVSVQDDPGQPEWLGNRDDVTADVSYGFDADGQLVAKSDRHLGLTRFEYDPIGQLIAAIPEKTRAQAFRYDPTGNLHEVDGPPREYGRGNRLLRRGTTEYIWDDEARLVEKREHAKVWRYAWDGAGLLRQVEDPDGKRIEFSYDPFARRVEKRVSVRDGLAWTLETRSRFVWSGDALVHEVRRSAAASDDPVVEERDYWFDDRGLEPLAHRQRDVRASEQADWCHRVNDGIGVLEHLVDDRGRVVTSTGRDPWGREEDPTPPDPFARPGLPGQYVDPETGLAYNRTRYYDPDLERYISPDPIGLLGLLNAYRYVPDPLQQLDPLGLKLVGDTFVLNDPYKPGSAKSNQLRRFAGAWNDKIAEKGGSMKRRCLTDKQEKESAAWKKAQRKKYPDRFDGAVVGHVPDAGAGGTHAGPGATAMALNPGVNASIGGQIGGMKPGDTYTSVTVKSTGPPYKK